MAFFISLTHCEKSFLKQCSQSLITCQPISESLVSASMSRFLFRSILWLQYSSLLFGIWPWIGHPCQKHPSTKIAIFCFGKIISGLPGREEYPLTLYLNPDAHKALLRSISGFVFLGRIRLIILLRVSFEILSAIL